VLFPKNYYKMSKSRRMRFSGHVARMEMRNAYKIYVGKLEGRVHLK